MSALCDEVSSICEVTRLVCINRGYEEYAATYLSSEKFVKLLLRQDREKLKRLKGKKEGTGNPFIIGVLGCMAERVREQLIEQYHADIVVGPDAYMSLPDLIAQVECGQKAINVELSTTETYRDIVPQRICGPHISGFVSIMRGCNNFNSIRKIFHS